MVWESKKEKEKRPPDSSGFRFETNPFVSRVSGITHFDGF